MYLLGLSRQSRQQCICWWVIIEKLVKGVFRQQNILTMVQSYKTPSLRSAAISGRGSRSSPSFLHNYLLLVVQHISGVAINTVMCYMKPCVVMYIK